MKVRRTDPIGNMRNFLEGDWSGVVDYFQEVHKGDTRREAQKKADVERARFLSGDKNSRIHLFDMGRTIKVWKGRETKPAWAKFGLSDPYSDPNNLRNTLVRILGVGTYWSPADIKDLFESLYDDEADSKYKIAADKRYPIIQRSTFMNVAVWHLAGLTLPPSKPEDVIGDEGASAHYLSVYGGKINGLSYCDVCHAILELNGRTAEEGYEAFVFAEKEFHDIRNCRPRKGTKRDKTKIGVLWFDKKYFDHEGTNLWYDSISAQSILRQRELAKMNHLLKVREDFREKKAIRIEQERVERERVTLEAEKAKEREKVEKAAQEEKARVELENKLIAATGGDYFKFKTKLQSLNVEHPERIVAAAASLGFGSVSVCRM
jgi:hypothetical protein